MLYTDETPVSLGAVCWVIFSDVSGFVLWIVWTGTLPERDRQIQTEEVSLAAAEKYHTCRRRTGTYTEHINLVAYSLKN